MNFLNILVRQNKLFKYTQQKFYFYNKQSFLFSDVTGNKIKKIKEFLSEIKTENGKNIDEMGILNDIKEVEGTTENGDDKKFRILLNLHKDYRKIKHLIETKIKQAESVLKLDVNSIEIAMAPQEKKSEPTHTRKVGLSKVKNIIAVSSCKGGVGKSTIAVNLAFSLLKHGKKVGIFDADVYGPSLPILINPKDSSLRSYEDNPQIIIPIEFSGIKAMSFGFAAPGRRAVMRGPIVSNLVTQLACNTDWGELDYLVIDMPPGTGDIQISLCQELNFTGGVVITTPQKLSFIDVVKGIEMFDELKIPILSVVENMSYFTCDNCDKKHHIFGQGYIKMLKKQFGIEDSFSLPIDPLVSKFSDVGSPYVLIAPDTDPTQQIFKDIATKLIKKIETIEQITKNKPVVEYEPKENVLFIKHEEDKIKKISSYYLRKKCICAACIDEFTGEKLLKEKSIPRDVHPKKIEDKGNYAVAIVWSDGHRSSIYPYKRLLSDEIESI